MNTETNVCDSCGKFGATVPATHISKPGSVITRSLLCRGCAMTQRLFGAVGVEEKRHIHQYHLELMGKRRT